MLKVINLCFRRPSVILGVTNPFFAKTLQHWPHIIRIGDMKQAGKRYSFSKLRHTGSQSCSKRCVCAKSVLMKQVMMYWKWRRNINLSDHSFHHLALTGEMAKQMKVKKLKNLKTLDSKPGRYFTSPFYSIYFSVLRRFFTFFNIT